MTTRTTKARNGIGICVMVVTSCLVLAVLWAVLVTPETALAAKPGDGGKPEVLHGSATFRDDPGDRVSSDGGGIYTYTGSGKGTAVELELGDDFFRFRVREDSKGVGRRFDLDFGGLDIDPAFFPEKEDTWSLYVGGTLEDFRNVPLGAGIPMVGRIRFAAKGAPGAYLNYGAAPTGGGTRLTVTRIDTDTWRIESKAGDEAHLFRDGGEEFGYFSMPFLITYYGQGMP